MIEQAKFIYSPLGKALEKQTKAMEDKKKKKKDSAINQNERQVGSINNDGKNVSLQEIFKNMF